jgi:hypothetical protein
LNTFYFYFDSMNLFKPRNVSQSYHILQIAHLWINWCGQLAYTWKEIKIDNTNALFNKTNLAYVLKWIGAEFVPLICV